MEDIPMDPTIPSPATMLSPKSDEDREAKPSEVVKSELEIPTFDIPGPDLKPESIPGSTPEHPSISIDSESARHTEAVFVTSPQIGNNDEGRSGQNDSGTEKYVDLTEDQESGPTSPGRTKPINGHITSQSPSGGGHVHSNSNAFGAYGGRQNGFSQQSQGYQNGFPTGAYAPFPYGINQSAGSRFGPSYSNGNNLAHDQKPNITISSPSKPSSSAAIDLTDESAPPPKPSHSLAPPKHTASQTVLIGSIDTQGLVLYPVPLMQKGNDTASLMLIREVRMDGAGDEWLRVRMKLKRMKKNSHGFSSTECAINIGNLKTGTALGVLNETLLGHLGPFLQKGLARIEGWIKRGDTEKMYIAPLSVLIFTLPSNVQHIANALSVADLWLDHPSPYYDGSYYADNPPYQNPHNPPPGGFRAAKRARLEGIATGHALTSGYNKSQQNVVEIERAAVDKVFSSLKGGDDLHETQPGPSVKTRLFSHQAKGLTFLQQREGEPSAIKAALAQQPTLNEDGIEVVEARLAPGEAESKHSKKRKKRMEKVAKMKGVNSLWEPTVDEDGKVREWRNLVTDVVVLSKEKPREARGAILADDMGLGKTIMVIALIASTRESAYRFAQEGLQDDVSDSESASDASDLSVSHFENSVYGMPDSMAVDAQQGGKGTKRKAGRDLKFDRKKVARLEGKARRERLTARSRATLLVCPLTTLSNWEDQLKEHWNGNVEIVNGFKKAGEKDVRVERPDLRVYIYHGPSRVQEAAFLNQFDIVITTFTTMQTEYTRQVKTSEGSQAYASGANSSSGEREETPEVPEDWETEQKDEDGKPFVRGAERPEVAAERLQLNQGQGRKAKRTEMDLLGRPTDREVISPLQAIEWFRVVLDEAHFIKDPTTIAAKAACYLEAQRRICLTGTPIQNKLDDVWALFKFLRLSPFDEKEVWKRYISDVTKKGSSTGIVRLQTILKHCTLRRTKESTNNEGQKIINLPPKKESRVELELNEEERKIYAQYAVRAKHNFDASQVDGAAKMSMVNILQEILRLRQICDHWELVDGDNQDEVEEDLLELGDVDLEEAQAIIVEKGVNLRRAFAVTAALHATEALRCQHCGYAFELPRLHMDEGDEDAAPVAVKGKNKKAKGPCYPVLTKCCHVFCTACFQKHVFKPWPKNVKGNGRQCSLCQGGLALGRDVIEVSPGSCTANQAAEGPRSKAAKRRLGNETGKLSTKMQALLTDMIYYSSQNPASKLYNPEAAEMIEMDEDGKPLVTKSVVFSQWTSMLDKIEVMLDKVNIRYSRLDGTMKRDARSEAMDQFKADPGCEIILVSLRAGGVGLNLTAATRCYLMDPYWNPAVENQAVDRIHRMGQKRPVTIIKYIVKDSMEERMLEVQKRKQAISEMSLDQKLSKKELHDRRIEDLKIMFS